MLGNLDEPQITGGLIRVAITPATHLKEYANLDSLENLVAKILIY